MAKGDNNGNTNENIYSNVVETSTETAETTPTHTESYRIPEVHVEVNYSDPADIHEYDDVIYNDSDEAMKKDLDVENFAEIDLSRDDDGSTTGGPNTNPNTDLEGNVVFANGNSGNGNFALPTPRLLLADKVIEDEIDKEKASAIYANKKTIAQGMLDIALLTANTSQLRVVLQADDTSMRKTLITFISFSIALQVVVGLCLLYIGTLDKEHRHKRRANIFNNVVTMLIFMITITNVMVSSFGLENMHHTPRSAGALGPPAPPRPTQSPEP